MKSRSNLTPSEIETIINGCQVCSVAMVDGDGAPYVLPFNFGYSNGTLYLHSGPTGKKMEVWARDPRVCVAFSTDHQMRIQNPEVACSYSMRYRSVLLHGRVKPITELDRKEWALGIIMAKYAGRADFTYSAPALNNVRVFEILSERVEGRIYGY